ncbi:MAG TPA: twin-arginine translocase TatA/TatE family subunit, partial [Vicinamibacteria bacterium]|nr:twin-arginine translocase TatA/TatE family subunit [Vicinamibacteria bacterium]
MFGTLGGQEIVLILVLALIVFGPRKLPEIGRTVGRMLAEFRKASNEFRRTIEDEVDAERRAESVPQIAAAPVADGVTSTEPPAASVPAEATDAGAEPPSADRPTGDDLPAGTEGAAAEPAPPTTMGLPGLAPPAEPTV